MLGFCLKTCGPANIALDPLRLIWAESMSCLLYRSVLQRAVQVATLIYGSTFTAYVVCLHHLASSFPFHTTRLRTEWTLLCVLGVSGSCLEIFILDVLSELNIVSWPAMKLATLLSSCCWVIYHEVYQSRNCTFVSPLLFCIIFSSRYYRFDIVRYLTFKFCKSFWCLFVSQYAYAQRELYICSSVHLRAHT